MIGEIKNNNKGTPMRIIAARSKEDIDVEFLDEHHYIKRNNTYSNFIRGTIKNPFDKSVFDAGYIGNGIYSSSDGCGGVSDSYNCWRGIIERCYSDKWAAKHPAYYDKAEICVEWLNFQEFAKWFDQNSYDIGSERLHLDKDIQFKGNKIYSPYHCILIPQSINEQFKEHSGKRRLEDQDLPYTIRRSGQKFKVNYRGNNLGTYNTVNECVIVYEEAKRKYVKELLKNYEGIMPHHIKQVILDAIA